MMGSGKEGRGAEGREEGRRQVRAPAIRTFVKFRVFIMERYLCSFPMYHLLVSLVSFQLFLAVSMDLR